jgi:hypothetical protein
MNKPVDTPGEYVRGCKAYARTLLEMAGDDPKRLRQVIATFIASLAKDPKTANHPAINEGASLGLSEGLTASSARNFIDRCKEDGWGRIRR